MMKYTKYMKKLKNNGPLYVAYILLNKHGSESTRNSYVVPYRQKTLLSVKSLKQNTHVNLLSAKYSGILF